MTFLSGTITNVQLFVSIEKLSDESKQHTQHPCWLGTVPVLQCKVLQHIVYGPRRPSHLYSMFLPAGKDNRGVSGCLIADNDVLTAHDCSPYDLASLNSPCSNSVHMLQETVWLLAVFVMNAAQHAWPS